ncbi:T6SS amidase immunity protein Tai4 family protein [Vibrio parahaemolyticus]|uniref:T6SS amidase immunity protein Tai4 family protein n=1 Tax=Vibrio parahaemolyticus TaxID=670 RepID=UPI0004702A88|nr:T6SS amidase immunity protein Tai4 family protein [Vibrio parahaemolyticus]
METRRLVSSISITLCSLSVTASPLSTQSDEQLFKNFALASCIATYYKGSDVAKDAITAMQGYREFSELPLESFFEVSYLLEKDDMASYKSKNGSIIELAYCVDFSNSASVKKLYTKAKSAL